MTYQRKELIGNAGLYQADFMMNDLDLETLWVGAFRYYLGRRTYAVQDFCYLLIEEWQNIPATTQNLILRETEAAIKGGWAGDDCDMEGWKLVLEKGAA